MISEFGLAKLDEEDNTHISTKIAGTKWISFLSFAPLYYFWLLSVCVCVFFSNSFCFITFADLVYELMWIDIDLLVSIVVFLPTIW